MQYTQTEEVECWNPDCTAFETPQSAEVETEIIGHGTYLMVYTSFMCGVCQTLNEREKEENPKGYFDEA